MLESLSATPIFFLISNVRVDRQPFAIDRIGRIASTSGFSVSGFKASLRDTIAYNVTTRLRASRLPCASRPSEYPLPSRPRAACLLVDGGNMMSAPLLQAKPMTPYAA